MLHRELVEGLLGDRAGSEGLATSYAPLTWRAQVVEGLALGQGRLVEVAGRPRAARAAVTSGSARKARTLSRRIR